MALTRKGDKAGKKVSRLYVEPAEVARKLVKELESTKFTHAGQVWIRDRYTVFLCREDYNRFRVHIDKLVAKFTSHLENHLHVKRYSAAGDVQVELTMDPDLKPGYFGVLAEDGDSVQGRAPVAPGTADSRAEWDLPQQPDHRREEDYAKGRSRGGVDPFAQVDRSAPPLPGSGGVDGMAPPIPSLPATPPALSSEPGGFPPQAPPPLAKPSYTPPPAQEQAPPSVPPSIPSSGGAGGAYQDSGHIAQPVGPGAAPGGEPLVVKVDGQEQLFPRGEVTIGRSRDVDVRIDNPDVSRRHAVISISEGSVVVKDLGSTNGTMVNGYPVDSTTVGPTDVIRIGDCQITAYPR